MAPPQRETQSVGGVDVGISPLAVDSGGEHPNPEAHYQPVQTSNGNWQYPNPRAYGKAVVKMVDFSYKPSSAIPDTLPLGNAAVPTVQDDSTRDSHPGTPS